MKAGFHNHLAGIPGEAALRLFHIRRFHIADDGLPTVIHMNVLDADKLLPAITQASKQLYLHRKCLHQTRRRRRECRNSPLRSEGGVVTAANRWCSKAPLNILPRHHQVQSSACDLMLRF